MHLSHHFLLHIATKYVVIVTFTSLTTLQVSPNKHNVTDDVSALGECENEQKAGTLATGGKASTDSGVSSPGNVCGVLVYQHEIISI